MSVLAILLGGALGKLLGFGREVTLAFFFGATSTADAFRAGLAAALFPTHFFMGDVLDGAFVPLYSRYLRTNPASGRRLLRLTGTYLLAVSTGLAALTWIVGPHLVRIFAPGLSSDTVTMSARMLRWMGLGIPFYCFAALYSLYGICHERFRPLALRTTFQNGALMLTIPIAAWLHNPEWLGLGFALAFVAYLSYTLFSLRDVRQADAAAAVRQAPDGHEFRTLFHTATPLVVTLILGQLLATIDRAAASFVGVGAVASLEYARAFVETPQVLVGYAVGTVALSRFTSLSKEEAESQVAALIFPLLTGVLAVMLVLVAAAPEIVTIVYRRGQFDVEAVRLVAEALRGLAVGAAFMVAVYIMMRIISAQMRNRENIVPMIVAVAVEVIALLLLVPRFGLLGAGLGLSVMQVILCASLAARLGLLGEFVRRLPGWMAGGALAGGAGWLGMRLEAPMLVRLGVITACVLAGWVAGSSVSAVTRGDLGALRARVGQAVRRLRLRAAEATR
jgi:putative peptidoglycan lipid II flippase